MLEFREVDLGWLPVLQPVIPTRLIMSRSDCHATSTWPHDNFTVPVVQPPGRSLTAQRHVNCLTVSQLISVNGRLLVRPKSIDPTVLQLFPHSPLKNQRIRLWIRICCPNYCSSRRRNKVV